ncbi:MAG TPA: hypothetical protein VLW06_10950 [Terriglobales bacterium]|nr:hypothetical protein [Terriglobales bacterium]
MILADAVSGLKPIAPTVPTSIAVAVICGSMLDLLKRLQSIPKITYYTTRLNIILRIIMSGLGTLGISWTWSAAGSGAHELVIGIPAWSALAYGVWHWAVQYGMQHGFEGILQVQRQLSAIAEAGGTATAGAVAGK